MYIDVYLYIYIYVLIFISRCAALRSATALARSTVLHGGALGAAEPPLRDTWSNACAFYPVTGGGLWGDGAPPREVAKVIW